MYFFLYLGGSGKSTTGNSSDKNALSRAAEFEKSLEGSRLRGKSCAKPAVLARVYTVDESIEQWSSYTKRFDYFVAANGIEVGR